MPNQDPRKFMMDPCDARGKNVAAVTTSRDFFRTLGKVGDLEVLNNVDGRIGTGLRALAGISENIRNDSGPVPSIFRQTGAAVLGQGADTVLDTCGISALQTRTQGFTFAPQVANRALGQATSIYDAVRHGQLDSFEDIPTAIAEFSNLEILLRSIFSPNQTFESKFKELCISPYAMDLVNLAPKHKFMFVVEFIFNAPYSTGPIYTNNDLNFAFVVKKSTRPGIQFDYEDVNYYNFRTKVLKKLEYNPMSMSFHDDIKDKTMIFYEQYLKSVSPIARIDPSGGGGNLFEEMGMDYANATVSAFGELSEESLARFSASSSTLSSTSASPGRDDLTPKTVIQQINLYHVFNFGQLVDVYKFSNPKITEMTLDDLDMADGGTGNEVNVTFVYDNVFIDPAVSIADVTTKLVDATNVGAFRLQPNLSGTQAQQAQGPVTSVSAPTT